MTDVLNKQQRSYCMSQIQGSDTKPEILLRKALWKNGLRYRLKNNIYGKPDIVFPGKKIVVFVDGCFWHGCPRHYIKPRSNKYFWESKIERNIIRDKKVNKHLKKNGWVVIRLWEHQIEKSLPACVNKISKLFDLIEPVKIN